MWAVQEQCPAERLGERRARLCGELRPELGERQRRLARDAHLDELVTAERCVEGLKDAGREPLAADLDDGFLMMRECSEVAALTAVELGRRGGRRHGASLAA